MNNEAQGDSPKIVALAEEVQCIRKELADIQMKSDKERLIRSINRQWMKAAGAVLLGILGVGGYAVIPRMIGAELKKQIPEGVTAKLDALVRSSEEKKVAIDGIVAGATELLDPASGLALMIPPVGSIVAWPSTLELGQGWRECNNDLIDYSKDAAGRFDAIVKILGNHYGNSAESRERRQLFLPDLRGCFLRGSGAGAGEIGVRQECATKLPTDPDAPFVTDVEPVASLTSNINLVTKTGTADRLLVFDRDYTVKSDGHDKIVGAGQEPNLAFSAPIRDVPAHSHKIDGGDSETRPVNYAVRWIIRVW